MIIYDNTAASGTVISSMTAIGGAEVPKMITFNLNFNTGLTIVTTGGAADVTVGASGPASARR